MCTTTKPMPPIPLAAIIIFFPTLDFQKPASRLAAGAALAAGTLVVPMRLLTRGVGIELERELAHGLTNGIRALAQSHALGRRQFHLNHLLETVLS